ncbi:unnamed protein product [Prunus armeniaca]|uniref:Uncharacterized protein n=1 Tax=Prunus armeniaca TaxID=36596 RepID=A0A6J5U856_PRUAR|nr:unnamed protein product [Prunus armeniaca]CAB4302654.1 unnamed protein product [Prunus armeniaca]
MVWRATNPNARGFPVDMGFANLCIAKTTKKKCELALEGADSQEHSDKIAMLVDDEELELRELQGSPNALGFSDHFTTNGYHACSLCKDLLAKFPPNSVKMK